MIFDTSSIYKAVEINCIEKLQGEKTLDLSLYELGNIVWKYVMRNKLSSDEGKKLIDILMDVISLMQIIETGINTTTTTTNSIAVKNRISYYDASYIHAALSSKEPLVSEDKKLLRISAKYGIKSYTIEDL